MLLGAIALTIVGGVWLFTKPTAAPDGPRPTAVVWTTTPTAIPTSNPTPTPLPLAVDQIRIGVRVRVTGTGGIGLSIRAEAGLGAERVAVVEEGTPLLIVGGPEQADEFTWWYVRDELVPENEGWAVEDYLAPTE